MWPRFASLAVGKPSYIRIHVHQCSATPSIPMRKIDEDEFRDSFRSPDSTRSGFYEPSISNRGRRTLQSARKRRPALWPRVAIGLILVATVLMLWFRFRGR